MPRPLVNYPALKGLRPLENPQGFRAASTSGDSCRFFGASLFGFVCLDIHRDYPIRISNRLLLLFTSFEHPTWRFDANIYASKAYRCRSWDVQFKSFGQRHFKACPPCISKRTRLNSLCAVRFATARFRKLCLSGTKQSNPASTRELCRTPYSQGTLRGGDFG